MKVDNFWNGDSRFYFMCNNGHKKKNKDGETEDDHLEMVQGIGSKKTCSLLVLNIGNMTKSMNLDF